MPWLSLWESCHRKVTEESLAPAGRHLPAKVPAFSDWTLPLFALSVLAALGHLSHRGGKGSAGTETVLRPSDFRAARALRGSRKTVNGAYRYRYAPFLVPIYDALALPLGELSPEVTERTLRPRDVICLRRCQHFPIGRCRYLPSPSSLRSATLPQGGKGECRDGNRFTTIRLSGGTRIEGSRKTVNGNVSIQIRSISYCQYTMPWLSFGRAVT